MRLAVRGVVRVVLMRMPLRIENLIFLLYYFIVRLLISCYVLIFIDFGTLYSFFYYGDYDLFYLMKLI